MQDFNKGDKVRVVSLTNTEASPCGLDLHGKMKASFAEGKELTVTKVNLSENAYRLDIGYWYNGADLVLADSTPKVLTIDDFTEGDEVRLVDTKHTDQQLGYDEDFCTEVGDTFTINSVDTDDDSVEDEKYNWYDIRDLELVPSAEVEVEVEEVGKEPLTANEVEEGDTLLIMSLVKTHAEFGATKSVVGDTLTIRTIDDDDDSVQAEETMDWLFLSDLQKADPAIVKEPEINYLLTRDSVTLSIDGNTEVATSDHVNFLTIRAHVLDGEYNEAMALMNVSVGIKNWGQGSLQIEDGKVVYVGMELTGKLIDRIIEMMTDGNEAFERFAKFLNLTMEQESFKTRERLMDFAAHDKLAIDPNGNVVAFKNVREDYYDKHSHKFRNMVGDEPSMRRSDVNDDHDVSCSEGLHVCSPTYLKGFWGTSGKTMRVVVDPRDFVAIPYDYKDSKARVCKYTVVEDVTGNISDYL